MGNKKISLIMATLGRTGPVADCLESLLNQTYKNFELIIIDQNQKGFLNDIIDAYIGKMDIKHICINEKGLSRARNIGLKYISGDIIGFPDDDCSYLPDTLSELVNAFNVLSCDGITGVVVHEMDKKSRFIITKLNLYNVWTKGISFTMFFRKETVEKVGFFDELLGVGSGTVYGSGEETDYMIRVLKYGFTMFNIKSLMIKHPIENLSSPKIKEKAYLYSKGRMYVLNKHSYGKIFVTCNMVYPLLKGARYFYNPLKWKFCWYQFKGRL